ncbi:MAG: sugar ABC transporter permease, partial [Oscillospiraceae bacterium]
PFAVLVALILAKHPFGWRFTRNVFVIPNLISTAAIGMIFMNIMDPDYGVINAVVRIFCPNFSINWLQDGRTAFMAVSLSWIFFAGQSTLLLLSEIASIPDTVIEAAKIDGATDFQIDLHIILPLLRNIVGTVSILAASFAITEFSEVFILTRGGPGNSTLNLGVYLYKSAMLENNYGLANTVGVLQLLLGVAAVFSINKLFRMGEANG